MNFDTPFVEYLIIGSHTFSWILLLLWSVFKIPMKSLGDIDAGAALLLLPVVYLFGMLFDSLYQGLLNKQRIKIRNRIIEYPKYKDELMALESPTLYAAYEVRMRRIRVIGAAIFNWPLLAISLLINLGLSNIGQVIFIALSTILLVLASIITWRGLFERAYDFRKSAIDEIRNKVKSEQKSMKK
jgi:hypothetical protein